RALPRRPRSGGARGARGGARRGGSRSASPREAEDLLAHGRSGRQERPHARRIGCVTRPSRRDGARAGSQGRRRGTQASVQVNKRIDRPVLKQIGKYPVTRKLGEGATSEVYLCHDSFNKRDVAIKVAFQETFEDPERGKLYKKLFLT